MHSGTVLERRVSLDSRTEMGNSKTFKTGTPERLAFGPPFPSAPLPARLRVSGYTAGFFLLQQ